MDESARAKVACSCRKKRLLKEFVANLVRNQNPGLGEHEARGKVDELIRRARRDSPNESSDEFAIKRKIVELVYAKSEPKLKPCQVNVKSRIPVLKTLRRETAVLITDNFRIKSKSQNKLKHKHKNGQSLIPVAKFRKNGVNFNTRRSEQILEEVSTNSDKNDVENEVAAILTNLHAIIREKSCGNSGKLDVWKYRERNEEPLDDDAHFAEPDSFSIMINSCKKYHNNATGNTQKSVEDLRKLFENLTITHRVYR